jgi:glycosyltransferase involved in cell wall biosynthesis
VSAHNAEQLRYAYPRLDVHEVVMDLRPEVFTFEPLAKKTAQVATIAKTPEAAAAVRMFHARAEAAPVRSRPCELVLIRNYTEAEVAEILKRSLVFMWLSPAEGLGRMPLEAMLSGCVVVSYAAGPLRTILPRELSCEYADPAQLLRLVEQVLGSWPEHTAALQTLVSSARERALTFGAREQERSVCDAWEAVLGKCGTKTAPLPAC